MCIKALFLILFLNICTNKNDTDASMSKMKSVSVILTVYCRHFIQNFPIHKKVFSEKEKLPAAR